MKKEAVAEYYRKHDDFRRYLNSNKKRVAELSRLYRSNKKYFGKSVLDLACGGGVLGFVIEPRGHNYVGVDINLDMVDSAKRHANDTGSGNRFILADVRSSKLRGDYDTITLLGNAMIHFTVADFARILKNVDRNVHRGTSFLIDYRDVVEMLFDGRWGKKYAEKRRGRTVLSRRKGIDTERGEILIESVVGGKHNLDFGHAIWSPFIMRMIMESAGWRLIYKQRRASQLWLDIYKKS